MVAHIGVWILMVIMETLAKDYFTTNDAVEEISYAESVRSLNDSLSSAESKL